MGVKRSLYYQSIARQTSHKEDKNHQEMLEWIEDIAESSDHTYGSRRIKRVFDLVKDLGTSQSTKIDSIFDRLLCPDRPAYVTILYCTSTASCSCATPS
ncbi:MAG: hypothetical protein KZQ63_14235 [Candidatus Thiodiazotropha sp. (ex Lucinoma aequizonata)]|nr:hypothetical protein [Candidatus Thiodiazotropha sp. (ex Lucinoma aequizonata)]